MHGLEIHVDVAPEKRREFVLAAEGLLASSPGAESACRSCRVFEQHGDPNHFLWREQWMDRAALEQRMTSSEFRTLLGALRVLGEAHHICVTTEEQDPGEEKLT